MSEYENRYVRPAPVGALRDRNKEISDGLLALDFEKVGKYPELQTTATITAEELNVYRKQFGLNLLPIEEDVVRLIGEQTYDANEYAKKASESGAFFHPVNRKIFVRFDEGKYNNSALEKMRAIYAVTHELGHRAMEKAGLSRVLKSETPGFDRLTEGLVDWLSKDILNRHILSKVTSAENLRSRIGYIRRMRPEENGFALTGEDIIPTSPEEDLFAFGYISEIRLIEHLQAVQPQVFQALLKAAFEGNIKKASVLLEETFGGVMRDKLGDSNISTRELFTEISGQK